MPDNLAALEETVKELAAQKEESIRRGDFTEASLIQKEQEQAEKVSDIRGEVKEIGFGNQIRSYVMQPYTLVKDRRTGEESANVSAVLDGDLDPFMNAYLKAQQ